MSQEILEIVQEMDSKDIELQIAFQCAPLLAGLKLSNLLMVQNGDYEKVRNLLKGMRITYFIMAVTENKTAMLLFDRLRLDAYLRKKESWKILNAMGYQKENLGRLLYHFRLRYEGHLRGEQEFPHEMGLFLGYPIEDVEGYMKDGGEHCLYTGYWKVYGNLSEKKRLFGRFEKARDLLIQMLFDGLGMVEIVQKRLLVQMVG